MQACLSARRFRVAASPCLSIAPLMASMLKSSSRAELVVVPAWPGAPKVLAGFARCRFLYVHIGIVRRQVGT